jgi:predicted TIM-barrel fold metal-dependent hydrolase
VSNAKLISSDSHVFEPADLWTDRIDRRFRDRAPQVRGTEDGDWWFCDDLRVTGVFGGTQTGLRFDKPEDLSMNRTFDQVRMGGYVPDEHVKDMDVDGIAKSILYPSIGIAMYRIVDSELLTAICDAYNGWLAEFCAGHRDRLFGVAMLNSDEVGTALRQLERAAELGLIGALIPIRPLPGHAYDSPDYEPLWARAEELGIPLSLHTSTIRTAEVQEGQTSVFLAQKLYGSSSMDSYVRESLGDIVMSGVFERHPGLTVGSVEVELGWAPFFLRRLDYLYTQTTVRKSLHDFADGAVPSNFLRRNVFYSFQEDDLGIRLRDVLGVDRLLWGNDYPHIESTWPRSENVLDDILDDCTADERTLITKTNTERIYRLN